MTEMREKEREKKKRWEVGITKTRDTSTLLSSVLLRRLERERELH